MTSKNKKIEEKPDVPSGQKTKKAEEEKPEKTVKKKTTKKEAEKKPKTVKKKTAKKEEKVEEPTQKTEEKKPEHAKTIEQEKPAEEPAKETAEEPSRGGFQVEEAPEIWVPKTTLGKRVYKGEITSMKQLMKLGIPIKETGIINKLMPELKEEIVDVGRVQRVTDSGRRMRFRVVAVVGNEDGYIGIGEGKGKEVGPAIRQAIDHAKLSIREVKRGCGSWECGCGLPHTVPVTISAKVGSVQVTIKPAPQGVGLVSGEIAKKIMGLAGIKDAWVKTGGHTRTGINFAHAVFQALVNTNYIKISEQKEMQFKIISGSKEEQQR